MKRIRLKVDDRKELIMSAALAYSMSSSYASLTRERLAELAGVSTGLVSAYFGTMPQLRRSIMRAAIAQRRVRIVADGLAQRDPLAKKAPDDLQREARAMLASGA